MAQDRGGRLSGIDGLRGIAALTVVLNHYTARPGPQLVPLGFLGVELFFCISGFILAFAYEDALARGLGAGAYALQRWIRLYPVYVLATLSGFAVYALDGVLLGGANPALPSALALLKSLLLIPASSAFPMEQGPYFEADRLFPFDNPSWSLLIEALCSAIFLAWRPQGRALALTLIVLGGLLVVVTKGANGIGGFNQSTFLLGLPRGLFCFYSGLAIYRLWRADAFARLLRSPVIAAATVAIGSLCNLTLNVYLVVVFVAAPLLVTLATTEPRSPGVRRLFVWLGDVSYPLYLLHIPLFALARLLADVTGVWPATELWPRAASLGLAPLAVALAALCAKFYDAPMRRWLCVRLPARRAEPAREPAGVAATAS